MEWEKTITSYLRTWGCLAKVNVPIPKKRKLGPKTVDCVLLGYAQRSIAYRFLVVNLRYQMCMLILLWNLVMQYFFENIFPMKDMHSNSRFLIEITPQPAAPIESYEQSDEHVHVLEKDDSEAPRRCKRKRIANLLVMISLCTLWTILPCLLQRRMHLQMQMIGKKQSKVRWTQNLTGDLHRN